MVRRTDPEVQPLTREKPGLCVSFDGARARNLLGLRAERLERLLAGELQEQRDAIFGSSLSRAASTHPVDPAPTTM
jgi:hypothetical protein